MSDGGVEHMRFLVRRTPVVVMSGDATPSQIERLLVLGAGNYLTQPFRGRTIAIVDDVMQESAAAGTT